MEWNGAGVLGTGELVSWWNWSSVLVTLTLGSSSVVTLGSSAPMTSSAVKPVVSALETAENSAGVTLGLSVNSAGMTLGLSVTSAPVGSSPSMM